MSNSYPIGGRRMMIDKSDITSAATDDAGSARALADGEALFRVDRVALTANNVTYAAAGDMMGYWRFFPMPDGQGGLPVWGYGDCVASEAKGLKKGDRAYGYWPLAEQLIVQVADVDGQGFSDATPHRDGLSPVYNRYDRVDADADDTHENVTALFRPLFTTGWLIAQQLEGANDYGATQVILSSASSKTALACAWSLARREEDRPQIIGLTSSGNVDFCKALCIYDHVVTYEEIGKIPDDQPSVFVDFAGNADVRLAVHERLTTRLGRSITVGMTHWDEARPEGGAALPGPEPKMFFAPDVMTEESRRLGADGFRRAMAGAWSDFAAFISPHMSVTTIDGIDAARDAYVRLAKGEVSGTDALII
ncbi:MAG: DUF2855 family protein, partial [Pacificimonas sp.]